MTKKEIAEAQALIDSVTQGTGKLEPVKAVFPESRGPMTAQQFWKEWQPSDGQKAFYDDTVWKFADTLSARNTAELRAALADTKEELQHVLDDWNDLVKDSGSRTNGAAIGHVAKMRAELERLRSQGVGPWIEEAAKEIVYKIRKNFYPEDVPVFADIIRKHAIRALHAPAGLASPPEGQP